MWITFLVTNGVLLYYWGQCRRACKQCCPFLTSSVQVQLKTNANDFEMQNLQVCVCVCVRACVRACVCACDLYYLFNNCFFLNPYRRRTDVFRDWFYFCIQSVLNFCFVNHFWDNLLTFCDYWHAKKWSSVFLGWGWISMLYFWELWTAGVHSWLVWLLWPPWR